MSLHDMTTSAITCAACKHAYAENALFCPNCGRPKARETAPSADPLVGKLLGERFQVQELIGQGGSGTIYRAEHVTLRRRVAIKVLHNELSRDDLAVERFRREATTVAEIDNEHIVEIHDFGRTFDGRLYLAMELLEGETLDGVLAREKTLSVEKTADILIQVGEALMEAHAIGYVHRDLRPRNIYLAVRRGKANFVKLLDFGLSKLVESDAQAASTSLGMTFGDPRYMSPEQARGDRIDRRADIYQLGCVAYEMLTGTPPFTGNRVFDILTKQVTEIPQPLPTRRPGVPLWVEAAVAKMLAKDPENRFATTTRMIEALRRGLDTGEVMEDEVARRRESIPPPSVSRMMQRMGMASPTDSPREPQRELPPLPQPSVAEPVVAERKRTGTPQVGVPVVSQPSPAATQTGVGVWTAGQPAPTVQGVPAGPAPIVQPAVAGSIETGPVAAPKPPVVETAAPKPPVVEQTSGPVGRAKRASSAGVGESANWYEEGERASEEADHYHDRARKVITPSTTDLSLYDEVPPKRRGLVIASLLGVLVLGGGITFALTRNTNDDKPKPPAPPPTELGAAAVPSDAAPSTIIAAETPDAAPAAAPADAAPAVAKTNPPITANVHHDTPIATNVGTNAHSHDHDRKGGLDIDFGVHDDSRRHPPTPPAGGGGTPPTGGGTTTTGGGGTTGVSGTDGPVDPYGGGGTVPDPGNDASPEKKAEFYANLGSQQLASSDTAGAAASFKKASELDPKNVNAVTGMGEIALRQGLFGDAIAHLKRAARMAPKSSRVYTLLGEAYLNSGQNAVAAENFKKALQLDPDNKRAREGYDDASSKVPPPTDDN
jgi:serine/threonine protein kinase